MCADNLHSSTCGVATKFICDLMGLDRRKPGENTFVCQSCHILFSRVLAYPTMTVITTPKVSHPHPTWLKKYLSKKVENFHQIGTVNI